MAGEPADCFAARLLLGRARWQTDRTAPRRHREHRDWDAEGGERTLDRAAATAEGESRDLGIRRPCADKFTKRTVGIPATDYSAKRAGLTA